MTRSTSAVRWSLAIGLISLVVVVLATRRNLLRSREASEGDLAAGLTAAVQPTPLVSGSGPSGVSDAAPQISTSLTAARQSADRSLLDPRTSGWDSEAFAETATSRLEAISKLVSKADSLAPAALEPFVTGQFTSSPLRPQTLNTVFSDNSIRVLRSGDHHQHTLDAQVKGPNGLAAALRQLAQPLRAAHRIRTHVKVVNVALTGAVANTVSYFEASSDTDTETVQINATWHCRWEFAGGLNEARLAEIRVEDYEEVVASGPSGKWFADCTQAVLGHNPFFHSQLLRGHHHWLKRIETVHRFDTSARNGLAVGDVNGDGLEDLYLCQPPGLPNRLFVQNPDGTANDRAAQAGVDWLDQTSGALLVDLDNDGDQDLVVGTPAGVLLMENDSVGTFELRSTLELDYDVQSLSAADYDNDGDLDLFACVYRTASRAAQVPFLYRDATGGGWNRLYRNDLKLAEWQFTDVTQACGLDDGADRYSMAACWEDYDNDGDQDLYVANDFGRNYLYENREGRFVDVAQRAGVLDIGSGMSVSWGDYNRDGLMDLYVGNMFSSAGQRVTSNPSFRPGEDSQVRTIYQRLAKGNSLFAGTSNGKFRELGAEAGVEMGRWAWSSLFVDLNNDGWEDLLVANGYFTTEDSGDL